MILHLKIIRMTERTGLSPTMLSAVCRPPHFDSWRTDIQEEARRWLIKNIEAQSRIHEILHWRLRGSEGACCTTCNSSSSRSLPSKYFSWGLTLHFFWLGKKDYDHISCCMQLSYFCLFCSSPGVLMLSQSRRYTRSKEKNLLVVDVLNYVHVHHGQDVHAVLGEGPAPSPGGGLGATPPLHLLQTLGGAVFCLFWIWKLEIRMKNVESLICHQRYCYL